MSLDYVAYYRISTKKEDKKQSVKMQEFGIEKFAKDKRFNIVKRFFDDASAFGERPDFDNMIEYLNKNEKIKGVIIYHWDRLIRDPDEYKDVFDNFTLKNKEIWELTGLLDLNDPSVELVTRIRTAVSKHEVQRTRQRTKDAIKAARAAGKQIGRPKKPFSIKKLKKFLEGEEGKETFIFSKKDVAEKFFSMTVKTFNDRLRKHGYDHLIDDIPKQFKRA